MSRRGLGSPGLSCSAHAGSYGPAAVTFPGQNGKIVFNSRVNVGVGKGEIFVMNPDGTGRTQLTSNTTDDTSPRWSPDGSRIVFTSERDGNYEIYIMSADGSGQTRLTNAPGTDNMPSVWSADGARISVREHPRR